MERTKQPNVTKELVKQVKAKAGKPIKEKKEFAGNIETMISTGSTLLDLAISGGRVKGGGIPGGILVEIFGPSGSGKTIMLCEIAGAIQRHGGQAMFHDPEARLNKQFAQMFDLDTNTMDYTVSNTIPEVFGAVRKWMPKNASKGVINGVFADSLAALSTDMEMENEEGDKMGMRRAKEFSEELRRTCRILSERNLLMVCSNQVRQNMDAGKYGVQFSSPGGTAIGFYSSLRLRVMTPTKIKLEKTVAGKKATRVIGIETTIEVFKSSVWKPFRTAPITILFDYGIDNLRDCLQYIKDFTENKVYTVGGRELSNVMEKAIKIVEDDGLEEELKEEVVALWEEIEEKFEQERKPKQR